jgi:hypothetical protein
MLFYNYASSLTLNQMLFLENITLISYMTLFWGQRDVSLDCFRPEKDAFSWDFFSSREVDNLHIELLCVFRQFNTVSDNFRLFLVKWTIMQMSVNRPYFS